MPPEGSSAVSREANEAGGLSGQGGGGGHSAAGSFLYDQPLSKGKSEVSMAAFAFLFSELVQYSQSKVKNVNELEKRLEDAGHGVGVRLLELLIHREKANKREIRLISILSFIHSTVWRTLFGKTADSLEKGTDADDEYMISDANLLVNKYVSVPRDMGHLNCGAYVAGIVKGILDGGGFFPARVTAHFVEREGDARPRTTILIKVSEEVVNRERRLG